MVGQFALWVAPWGILEGVLVWGNGWILGISVIFLKQNLLSFRKRRKPRRNPNQTYLKFSVEIGFRESDKRWLSPWNNFTVKPMYFLSGRYSTGLAPWNNAVNERITLLWKGYSTGQRTPSIIKFTNSKLEIRNTKQIMIQIRNPNFEIRNNTQIQISKILNYSIR